MNRWPSEDQRVARLRNVFVRLPRIVGRLIVNFSLDNWRRQGFLDKSLDPWPSRRRADAREKSAGRRALLVRTGRLRRSIRIIRITPGSVTVGSDLPYAAIHNYGGQVRIKGRPYVVIKGQAVWIRNTTAARRRSQGKAVKMAKDSVAKIPARKYLGRSEAMDQIILHRITQELSSAWQSDT